MWSFEPVDVVADALLTRWAQSLVVNRARARRARLTLSVALGVATLAVDAGKRVRTCVRTVKIRNYETRERLLFF